MANSSNVTIRVSIGRPLLYEEVDANFQELVSVIDAHNAHTNSTTAHQAFHITYDNTTSGLAANEVKGALDEIVSDLNDHLLSAMAHDAYDIVYDNANSSLAATDVNGAIDEVQTNLETHENAADPHPQYTTHEEAIAFAIAL